MGEKSKSGRNVNFIMHFAYTTKLPSDLAGGKNMAEKKIKAVVKLQLPAGKATAGPPVGSSLGPQGINIPAFTKDFNEKTASQEGLTIPVIVTIYQDRSFEFIMKTPPAAVLIKKAISIPKGADNSIKNIVGKITKEQIKSIAEIKMPDLNADSIESAMKIIEGTCRSMGVTVTD